MDLRDAITLAPRAYHRVTGELHYTYPKNQFPYHLYGNGNKTPVVTVELNPNHYEAQDTPKATPSL